MGLIGKVLLGKTAADFAGKKARKVEKKVKKRVKRTKKIILLVFLSFCVGAACMGYFTFTHREMIAAARDGKKLPKGKNRCCGKALLEKLKK